MRTPGPARTRPEERPVPSHTDPDLSGERRSRLEGPVPSSPTSRVSTSVAGTSGYRVVGTIDGKVDRGERLGVRGLVSESTRYSPVSV